MKTVTDNRLLLQLALRLQPAFRLGDNKTIAFTLKTFVGLHRKVISNLSAKTWQ